MPSNTDRILAGADIDSQIAETTPYIDTPDLKTTKLNTLAQRKQEKLDGLSSDTLIGMEDADSLRTTNLGSTRSGIPGQFYDAVELRHGNHPYDMYGSNQYNRPKYQKSATSMNLQRGEVAKIFNKPVEFVTEQDMIDVGNQQQIQKLADLARTNGEDKWVAPLIKGVEQTNLTGRYTDENNNKINIPLNVPITSQQTGGILGRGPLARFGTADGIDVTEVSATNPLLNARIGTVTNYEQPKKVKKDISATMLEALKQRESSGRYNVENEYGYIGAYQFGAGRLSDLGIVKKGTKNKDLDNPDVWTGKYGMKSKYDFLGNPEVQNKIATEHLNDLQKQLEGSATSQSDLMGKVFAAHLLGVKGSKNLNATDANNTSGLEYYKLGAGLVPSNGLVADKPKGQSVLDKIVNFLPGVAQGFLKAGVLDTTDVVGEMTGIGDLGTETEKNQFANKVTGFDDQYSQKYMQKIQEVVAKNIHEIPDSEKGWFDKLVENASGKDGILTSINQAISNMEGKDALAVMKNATANTDATAQSLGVMAGLFLGTKGAGLGKVALKSGTLAKDAIKAVKVSKELSKAEKSVKIAEITKEAYDKAGVLQKSLNVLGRNSGMIIMNAGMVNDQLDQFEKNTGRKATVQEVSEKYLSNLFGLYLDRMSAGAILKGTVSKGTAEAVGNLIKYSPKSTGLKMAKDTVKVVSGLLEEAGTEFVQEGLQTAIEEINKIDLRSDKGIAQYVNKAADILTAAFAGAGGGLHMAAPHTVGGVVSPVISKLANKGAKKLAEARKEKTVESKNPGIDKEFVGIVRQNMYDMHAKLSDPEYKVTGEDLLEVSSLFTEWERIPNEYMIDAEAKDNGKKFLNQAREHLIEKLGAEGTGDIKLGSKKDVLDLIENVSKSKNVDSKVVANLDKIATSAGFPVGFVAKTFEEVEKEATTDNRGYVTMGNILKELRTKPEENADEIAKYEGKLAGFLDSQVAYKNKLQNAIKKVEGDAKQGLLGGKGYRRLKNGKFAYTTDIKGESGNYIIYAEPVGKGVYKVSNVNKMLLETKRRNIKKITEALGEITPIEKVDEVIVPEEPINNIEDGILDLGEDVVFDENGNIVGDTTNPPKVKVTGKPQLVYNEKAKAVTLANGKTSVEVKSLNELIEYSKGYDRVMTEIGKTSSKLNKQVASEFEKMFADIEKVGIKFKPITLKFMKEVRNSKGESLLGQYTIDSKGKEFIELATNRELGDRVYPMKLILHEYAHAITLAKLNEYPAVKARVEGLRKRVEKAYLARDKGNKSTDYYGLQDEYEFLAEAVSSPKFQELLLSMEGKELEAGTLDKLKRIFQQLLKRFTKDDVNKFNNTALGESLELFSETANAASKVVIEKPTVTPKPRVNGRKEQINKVRKTIDGLYGKVKVQQGLMNIKYTKLREVYNRINEAKINKDYRQVNELYKTVDSINNSILKYEMKIDTLNSQIEKAKLATDEAIVEVLSGLVEGKFSDEIKDSNRIEINTAKFDKISMGKLDEAGKKTFAEEVEVTRKILDKALNNKLVKEMVEGSPALLLIDKEGKFPEEVVEAMAVVRLEFVSSRLGDLAFNDDEQIGKMMGIDAKSVPYANKGKLRRVGRLADNEANAVGSKVFSYLPLKVSKGAKKGFEDRLKADLGRYFFTMLEADELIERGEIKVADLKPVEQVTEDDKKMIVYTYKVSKPNITKEAVKQEDGTTIMVPKYVGIAKGTKEKFDSVSEAFSSEYIKEPRFRKTKGNKEFQPRRVEDVTRLSSEQQKALNVAENTAIELRADVVSRLKGVVELGKKTGNGRKLLLAELGWKDPESVHIDNRDGIVGKNRAIEESLDGLLEFLGVGADRDVYFDYFFSKNGRFFIDSSKINPQTDLLHRFAFSIATEEPVVIDKSKFDEFKMAIVQAFDGSRLIGKNEKKLRAVLPDGTAITDIGAVDKQSPENTSKDFYNLLRVLRSEGLLTSNNNTKLLKAIKGVDHVSHAILAVEALKEFEGVNGKLDRVENEGNFKDFNFNMIAEIDSVNNGFALGSLINPVMKNYDNMKDVWASVGIQAGMEDEDFTYGTWKGKGGQDAYERGVEYVEGEIGKMLKNSETKDKAQAVLDLVGHANRNMLKYPLMIFVYGGGIAGITKGVTMDLVADLLNTMSTEKGYTSKKKALETMLGYKLPKSLDNYEKFREASSVNGDMKKVVGDITSAIQDVHGASIAKYLTNTFSEQVEFRDAVGSVFAGMFEVFNERFKKVLKAKQKEESKGYLSTEDYEGVLQEMVDEGLVPGILTVSADEGSKNQKVAIIDSQKTTDTGAKVRSSTGMGQRQINPRVLEYVMKPTSANVGNIHSFDGYLMMQWIMAEAGVGVHDALVALVGTLGKHAKNYNENMIEESLKFNMAEQILNVGIESSSNESVDTFERGVVKAVMTKYQKPHAIVDIVKLKDEIRELDVGDKKSYGAMVSKIAKVVGGRNSDKTAATLISAIQVALEWKSVLEDSVDTINVNKGKLRAEGLTSNNMAGPKGSAYVRKAEKVSKKKKTKPTKKTSAGYNAGLTRSKESSEAERILAEAKVPLDILKEIEKNNEECN